MYSFKKYALYSQHCSGSWRKCSRYTLVARKSVFKLSCNTHDESKESYKFHLVFRNATKKKSEQTAVLEYVEALLDTRLINKKMDRCMEGWMNEQM